MGYESDDDELVDAALLELHIQICAGEATGTPMLGGNSLARLRLEPRTDLAELGYEVTMVKDATAEYSDAEMHAALRLNPGD